MRALRLHAPAPADDHPLRLEELPMPEPGSGQVRLRVLACGVCHTDLHTIEGELKPPHLPVTPGHQVVGVIDCVGPSGAGSRFAEPTTQDHEQQLYGVPWLHGACGRCDYCRRGLENLCSQAQFTGFHVDGGYAEYLLARQDYILPLPAGLSPDAAAPLLCAGIVGYRSLLLVGVQPGETLGLVGFGASAHLCLQVALYWKCRVYVFTRSPAHRRHALELGASWAGGVEEPPPHLLDRAVIFAPSGALVPPVLEKLRPGGVLAINAIHMSPIPQMPYAAIYGERMLRSVANATYQDGVEFMGLAAEIPIRPTVSVYSLEDASRALVDLKYSRLNGEAVLRMAP
jgi:propanol-preferring alcohol dehydrogenase